MNKVYALIGPPASGKTSIAKALGKYGIPEMISHTTRQPKPGEQNGIDYHFVSQNEFVPTELIEKVNYSGHLYGLTKLEVLNKANKYPVSVVTVERQGLDQLRKLLGNRVESIYILVDRNTIIQRIVSGEDTADDTQQRIEYAEATGEFENWQIADYVVKNTGSLDVAVLQVLAIMGMVTPKSI